MVFYTLIDTKEKGFGEFVRLVLTQAKVEFVDKRVTPDEIKAIKPSLPTGSLPVLDAAGSHIGETNAIARYIGGLYHLYGANAIERAKIDQVLEVTHRLAQFFHASYTKSEVMKDYADMAKAFRQYGLKKAPEMLDNLEKMLTENGGHFFAGSQISIADIAAYFFLTFVAEHDSEFSAIYKKHAALNKHAQQVAASFK